MTEPCGRKEVDGPPVEIVRDCVSDGEACDVGAARVATIGVAPLVVGSEAAAANFADARKAEVCAGSSCV